MDANLIAILKILAAFLAYALVCNRMIAFAQPIRLSCAREGRVLLDNPNLTGLERQNLIFALANAYNPWFLQLGIVLLPIAVVLALFGFDRTKRLQRTADQTLCRQAEALDLRLLACHFLTSPLVGTIVAFEAVICLTLVALLGRGPDFIKTVLGLLESGALRISERHFRVPGVRPS